MVDMYQYFIFFTLVVSCFCEVCYYDDGSAFGKTTLCSGNCCGYGPDPCCVDTGSIIAIAAGGVISLLLVLVCVVVCCVQRAKTRRYTLARQERLRQRMSQLHTVSNQYQLFNSQDSEGNGQVDVPPRYSDLFPRQGLSDSTTSENRRSSRSNSGSSRSLSSFFRSSSRRTGRQSQNSGSINRSNTTDVTSVVEEAVSLPSKKNSISEDHQNDRSNLSDTANNIIVQNSAESNMNASLDVTSEQNNTIIAQLDNAVPNTRM